MKKYFDVDQYGTCLTDCPSKDGVKIGSAYCQICAYNIRYNEKESFVICDKLDEYKSED